MKMIRAVVRPQKEDEVAQALEDAGFQELRRWNVLEPSGRRRRKAARRAVAEHSKLCLMLVVPDSDEHKAVETIHKAARSGQPGDGRIFVSDVLAAHTIRAAKIE
ncbi:MAG TPA: P-II family nitrogen regulator [Bryobacteraceae bacterium]|nr:P-II family nitrogen regulator [Bryobacteraceae bacterium]